MKSPEITKVKISEISVIPWLDSIYSKLLYTVVRFRNAQVAGSSPVTSSSTEPVLPTTLALAGSLSFYRSLTLLSLTEVYLIVTYTKK